MKREYPSLPVVGVGAVVCKEGKMILVRRGSAPGRDKWSIPGGIVELGEKIRETVVREVREECTLEVEAASLIDVVENLIPDREGRLRYHFIILDFFTKLIGGNIKSGSDALDARWVPLNKVEDYDLTQTFREFFQRNREALYCFNST